MDNPLDKSLGITAVCPSTALNGTSASMNAEMLSVGVAEQMRALQDYEPETLRQKYKELTGADAAAFGTKFMIQRCAHRLQENAFGGLTADELATLDFIASHDPQVNPSVRDKPRSANDTRGVVYRRVYHGKTYEMRSLGGGRYEYDGKVYTSPTAVTRVITGRAHYNGVIFWGLKK